MALLCQTLTAQENTIRSLTVGDTVPDITFYPNACPDDSFKLSALKANLVIIDVWGAYCTPCMRLFPKLDSLNKEFDDQLQVLLLIANPVPFMVKAADSAMHHFEQLLQRQVSLPSVHTDTATTDLIYYKVAVPHYIWLDKNRRIIAATDAHSVTRENIRSLLEGKRIQMEQTPSYEGEHIIPGHKTTVYLPL